MVDKTQELANKLGRPYGFGIPPEPIKVEVEEKKPPEDLPKDVNQWLSKESGQ